MAGFQGNSRGLSESEWHHYGIRNDSYAEGEEERKRDFIAQFSQSLAPACAWDMGCNTGKYSEVLLQNKTKSIVGFDLDFDALEAAVSRAAIKYLHFLRRSDGQDRRDPQDAAAVFRLCPCAGAASPNPLPRRLQLQGRGSRPGEIERPSSSNA
jgi:SAM-dependent methyltransferase